MRIEHLPPRLFHATYRAHMRLFHATYRAHMRRIESHGLDPAKIGERAWSISLPGVIYLSTNLDHAESFCESSDEVPDEWVDEVVVFSVATADLEASLLSFDENDLDSYQKDADGMRSGVSLTYRCKIPVALLSRESE